MPRIISGELGGRTVPSPPGSGTRPTSDRVREAVFSRLQGWDAIAGRRVLDAYAGTGALSFEALSRGATSAVLVESHARTADRTSRAARELGLAERTEVRTGRAETVLPQLAERTVAAERFGLVFLDPPYDVPTERVEALIAALLPALTEDAVLVVERSSRTPAPTWPEGFADDGDRTYGETRIHFGGPVTETATADLPSQETS